MSQSEGGRKIHIHGEKGVYHSGDWIDMDSYNAQVSALKEKIKAHQKKGACGETCATCPRSGSCHSSAKADGSYDVIIIGAGCIGASVARELSKTTARVLWLEAADDVSQGATKGNSGIVHAGFDDKPGSVRSKFCWKGNQMFPELDRQLNFGYQRNGSLVLATKPEEIKILEELKERGKANGVERLQILNKEEVFKKEPFLNPDTIAALYSPDAGNLIPYEFTIALAENAVDNGVELKIRREVQKITSINTNTPSEYFEVQTRYWEPSNYIKHGKKQRKGGNTWKLICASVVIAAASALFYFAYTLNPIFSLQRQLNSTELWMYGISFILFILSGVLLMDSGATKGDYKKLFEQASKSIGNGGSSVQVDDMSKGGTGSAKIVEGETVAVELYRANFIVNCAGTYSDKISRMIGDDSFKIKPRLGDYLLLRKEEGRLATHTLFPCPDPKLGKGVLVQTTLWGNLILGPTARDMHDPNVANETADDIQTYILSKCKALVPSFDPKQVFHAFAGARAKTDKGDWIIEPSSKNRKFIQAAGIDSPGLAGSPAIALEVVRLLGVAGLNCPKNENFNPYRAPIITPKNNFNNLKIAMDIQKSSSNPAENIICKCEKVTEAEVVDAIHRSLPVDSTQAIRKRTRAGMGHCQGRDDNYDCECRVAAIIARETGLPVQAVGRRPWPGTSTLPQRWIDEKQKNHLVDLKEDK